MFLIKGLKIIYDPIDGLIDVSINRLHNLKSVMDFPRQFIRLSFSLTRPMRHRFPIIALFLWFAAVTAWSCQIPVFRYALELWKSTDYRLVVLHRGALDQAVKSDLLDLQNRLAKSDRITNLQLEVIDVDKVAPQARGALPGIDTMQGDQWLALVSPYNKTPVFAVPLDRDSLSRVMTSPAREQWAKKIVAGASVVWLVIPGEDQDETQRIVKTLEVSLAKAEAEIEIPEGVIKFADTPKDDPNFDMENVLRSQIPLKIQFPIMQIDAEDPAEACFLQMLSNDLPGGRAGRTVVVPLFGRGRILPPIPADKVTEESILAGCRYLCGACSCQVKDQNPGRDIVVQQDWDRYLEAGRVAIDLDLPPLQGAGEFVDQVGSESNSGVAGDNAFQRNVVIMGLTATVFLAAGTWLVRRK